jgi:hypothetical protein
VLIASPEALEALERQTRSEASELIALTDAEPLRALEIITDRRPDVIALEEMFAATPRGAALINRLKADPALSHTEIRVVQPAQSSPTRVVESAPRPAAMPVRSQPLDARGTRAAARVAIAPGVEILVDGNPARLVDLSAVGAQLISPTVLRPNQRVRVTLADERGAIRCVAMVAWASFEMPPKTGPQYRAGLQFVSPDAAAVEAFGERHRAE